MNGKDDSCSPSFCTKEYGCKRETMDSLAFFLYYNDFQPGTDAVQIYNEWVSTRELKPQNVETVLNILEYIRKLSGLDKKELGNALRLDYLI